YNGMMDLTLIYDIVASFRHLLIGLMISIVVGTGLGLLLAKSKTADETLGTMVLALQSVPSIVWVPLAIIWFGFGERSEEHTSELQSRFDLVCRLLLEKKNKKRNVISQR